MNYLPRFWYPFAFILDMLAMSTDITSPNTFNTKRIPAGSRVTWPSRFAKQVKLFLGVQDFNEVNKGFIGIKRPFQSFMGLLRGEIDPFSCSTKSRMPPDIPYRRVFLGLFITSANNRQNYAASLMCFRRGLDGKSTLFNTDFHVLFKRHNHTPLFKSFYIQAHFLHTL